MGNRILKESIHTSNTIAALKSWGAEVLFYRLVVACDDYGRFDGRAPVILGKCYPLVMDRVTVADVEGWLVELESVNLIRRYNTNGGGRFLAMQKWDNHQRIRAKYSKYPQPEQSNLLEDSPSIDSNGPPIDNNSGVNLNSDLNGNRNLKDGARGQEPDAPGEGQPASPSDPKPRKQRPLNAQALAVKACLDSYLAARQSIGQPYPGEPPAGPVVKWLGTQPLRDGAVKLFGQCCEIAVLASRLDPQFHGFPMTVPKFCQRVPEINYAYLDAAKRNAAKRDRGSGEAELPAWRSCSDRVDSGDIKCTRGKSLCYNCPRNRYSGGTERRTGLTPGGGFNRMGDVARKLGGGE